MATGQTQSIMRHAVEDIFNRSLHGVSNDFGQLIWIASTRDYNTGQYYHDGLESSFSREIAEAALAECHKEVFHRLTERSLEEFVEQLESYLASAGTEPLEVIRTWQKLEPYRIAIPEACDSLAAELFFSNVKVSLAVLRSRHGRSQ